MKTTLKAHIYDIANSVDLGQIETNLNSEGIYEGDKEFEERLKEDYTYNLKSYLLKKMFEDDELPDNFLDLIEDMKVKEIDSTEFFKTFEIEMGEPHWDDWGDDRKTKLRQKKLDKIKKSI